MVKRYLVFALFAVQALLLAACSNYSTEDEDETRDLSYLYIDVYALADSAGELLNSKVKYGTMTDPRDGKVYKTVKFGGVTWMAQNLDFAESSLLPNMKGGHWCYDDKESNCKIAGRLYTWTAAMDFPEKFQDTRYMKSSEYVISNFHRGICPKGWHLPSAAEFEGLLSADEIPYDKSGKIFKSTRGWLKGGNGDDDYGFSVLPAGMYTGAEFANAGYDAYFWTSTEKTDVSASGIVFSLDSNFVSLDVSFKKTVGRSVRCVQDTTDYIGYPASDTTEINAGDFNVDPASVDTGSFVDERDGHIYKTVKIGKYTWFAENLAYSTGDTLSFCYDNADSLCLEYGRLYRSDAAKNVCPDGTHLPTLLEFDVLFEAAKKGSRSDWVGKALKSADSWNGKDNFGFNALPAGGAYADTFSGLGNEALFWREKGLRVVAFADTSTRAIERYGASAASVRCVLGEVGDYKACNEDTTRYVGPSYDGVDSSYVEGGYLNDLRDDKFYKILTIGKQTWMAENLNYRHSHYNTSSRCNKDSEVCDSLGTLYAWGAVMDEKGVFAPMERYYCKSEPVHRGICPKGWHVPTMAEWMELAETVGGAQVANVVLRSKEDWLTEPGEDLYGFNAVPEFYNNETKTTGVSFWTSSDYTDEFGKRAFLDDLMGSSLHETLTYKKNFHPVRCVMDSALVSEAIEIIPYEIIPVESSSSVASSSSHFFDEDVRKAGSVYDSKKSTLLDERDNRMYKTVAIGSQVWMAENLSFDYQVETAKNYCSYVSKDSCQKYGLLYTWSAAMDSVGEFIVEGETPKYARGICPMGWHIPTRQEWYSLVETVTGSPFDQQYNYTMEQLEYAQRVLKSAEGWKNGSYAGIDSVHFWGYPIGSWDSASKKFDSGSDAFYWSNDPVDPVRSNGFALGPTSAYALYYNRLKADGVSVRCIKD